jgi:hypothetical protein
MGLLLLEIGVLFALAIPDFFLVETPRRGVSTAAYSIPNSGALPPKAVEVLQKN